MWSITDVFSANEWTYPADEEVATLVDVWEGEDSLDVFEGVGKRLFEISRVVAGVSRGVESPVYSATVAGVGVKVELVELVNDLR